MAIASRKDQFEENNQGHFVQPSSKRTTHKKESQKQTKVYGIFVLFMEYEKIHDSFFE